MTRRLLLAGVLGGLVLFLWEAVAHMALPLGEAGFRALPGEAVFMASVKEQVREDGLYLFPAPETRSGMTSAEKSKAMDAAMEKAKIGPSGLLLMHPAGEELTATQFVIQLIADVLVMLAAAWVLSKATAVRGLLGRAVFVTVLALIPILQVHVPYWNWYGFPAMFVTAAAVTHVVGFFAAGLVLGKMVGADRSMAAVA